MRTFFDILRADSSAENEVTNFTTYPRTPTSHLQFETDSTLLPETSVVLVDPQLTVQRLLPVQLPLRHYYKGMYILNLSVEPFSRC